MPNITISRADVFRPLLQLALRDGAVASALLAQVVGACYARRTAARRRQRLAAALAGLLAGPGDGAPLAPAARAPPRRGDLPGDGGSPDDALAAALDGDAVAAAAAAGAYETGAALLERARLVACGGSCVAARRLRRRRARRLLRLYAHVDAPVAAALARTVAGAAGAGLRRGAAAPARLRLFGLRPGRGAGRRGRRRRGPGARGARRVGRGPGRGPGRAARGAARRRAPPTPRAAPALRRRPQAARGALAAAAPSAVAAALARGRLGRLRRGAGAVLARRRPCGPRRLRRRPAPRGSRSSRRSAPTPRRGPAAAASRTAGPQCPRRAAAEVEDLVWDLRCRQICRDAPRSPAQTAPLDGQRLAAGALALSRGAVEVAQALCLKDKMFADNARGDIALKADFFLAAARRHADAGDGGGRERCCELYKKALEHAAERGPVHREFAAPAGASSAAVGAAPPRAQMDAAAQCLRADAESNDGAAAFAYADFLDEMLRASAGPERRAGEARGRAIRPQARPRATSRRSRRAAAGTRRAVAAAVASYLRRRGAAAQRGARGAAAALAVRVAARGRGRRRVQSGPGGRRRAVARALGRQFVAVLSAPRRRRRRRRALRRRAARRRAPRAQAPASVRDALRFAAERLPEGHPVLAEALAACFDDAAEAFVAAAAGLHEPEFRYYDFVKDAHQRAARGDAAGAARTWRRCRRTLLDASWDGVGARVGETNATFGQKLRKSPKVHAVDAAILKGRDVARACKDAKAEALARKNEMKGGPPRPDLAAYSRYLADFDGRDDVAVPGRPALRIARFRDQLLALASKQRPKRLTIVATDGAAYDYLVKGGEDLRLDDRVEQLFDAMGAALSRAGGAARRRGLAAAIAPELAGGLRALDDAKKARNKALKLVHDGGPKDKV
ncbi:phosphatidylinositol kinase [Aureococcus anophagefferens]|nr:phosphatidylinositol kinase [Aureococcus anophagefferens]